MDFRSVPGLGADQSPGRPMEDCLIQETDLAKVGDDCPKSPALGPRPSGGDAKETPKEI